MGDFLDKHNIYLNVICLLKAIEEAIDKMSKHHIRHIKAYDPREGKVINRIGLCHQCYLQCQCPNGM